MSRRVLAVVAAGVIALVGVAAVLVYAKGADQRAVAGQKPVEVYVAQKLVPAGTSAKDALQEGLIASTSVAAVGVPSDALRTVDDATGKLVATTDIAPGEFVLSSRFGTTPLGQKALQVPDGQVAITVQLTDPARVGTFVTPGSHIVIYDSYDPTGGKGANTSLSTQVLLDDVLVIAVGDSSLQPVQGSPNQQDQGQGASNTTPKALVTVALPPAQAARLVHGIQTGELYAGLRGADTKVDTKQVVGTASLFIK